jgi:hypothetical protein
MEVGSEGSKKRGIGLELVHRKGDRLGVNADPVAIRLRLKGGTNH